MRLLLAITLFAAACKGGSANPADCTDKKDMKACQNLCESHDKANHRYCFAERAFQMADCVDNNKGCDAACGEWKAMEKGAKMGDTQPVDDYKSFIAGKYDQMAGKCGGAADAAAPAAPAGSAAP